MIANVILGVSDISKTVKWYEQLFECCSSYGDDDFEVLKSKDGFVLWYLHKLIPGGAMNQLDHLGSVGQGVIIYVSVLDVNVVWLKARELGLVFEKELEINENSGRAEFSIRDIDGYYLIVSSV
jgi:predicted enzyme related to lactoylglutathione lyase